VTGNQIKELRESFEMSPGELATLLCVQASSVYRWEAVERRAAKVEGLSKRLLGLMSDLPVKDRVKVAKALRSAGWLSGLHKLVAFAYKKAS
jgi:predicted transcriptional regulator